MQKRLIILLVSIILIPSCTGSFLFDGVDLTLYAWTGLSWRWVNTGLEETATKRVVYEAQFGKENSLRLHQSMSVWNNLAFCFNGGDECIVYDLNTKERLSCGPIPDNSHHNNAQFSSVFYENEDQFPLLILSRGDYPPNQNDFYVVRIVKDNDEFAFTVVKTVHNTIQEARNCGSWVIDEEHGKLFLYCMTNGDWRVRENNHFCIYSFPLPDILDPTDVTLTYEDVLERWEYTYLVHQGGTYFKGYLLFNVEGITAVEGERVISPRSVIAVNSSNGHIDAILPLDDFKETEGICVYNDRLYVSFKYGHKYYLSSAMVFTLTEYSLPKRKVS